MKVGTDGVLLGAWCGLGPETRRILDAGSGTGLIALMAAQRCPQASVDAVEINGDACTDALRNFGDSPWRGRISLYNIPLQEYAAQCELRYDHILSNPPYFVRSLRSPDPSRTTARHTEALPYRDLVGCTDKLLAPDGKLSVILPPEEGRRFILLAAARNLYCSRRTEVYSKPGTAPKRILLEFGRQAGETQTGSLTLETGEPNVYTEEYQRLTQDFYLKF